MQRDGAAPMLTGDASRSRGGETPDHRQNETGLELNLRLRRTGCGRASAPSWRHHDYDRSAMGAQLTALEKQLLVRAVLYNDPELEQAGLCKRATGHHTYAHVIIDPPPRSA